VKTFIQKFIAWFNAQYDAGVNVIYVDEFDIVAIDQFTYA
jgi:hypothetical protein